MLDSWLSWRAGGEDLGIKKMLKVKVNGELTEDDDDGHTPKCGRARAYD